MPDPVVLSAGDHLLDRAAKDWSANYVWGTHPPMVELIASVESDSMLRGLPSRGSTATTLAIQMDARVAIALYEKLDQLAGKWVGCRKKKANPKPERV